MITNEQFRELAYDLEAFHGVFSRLWSMGKPIMNPEIPSACVTFDQKGDFFGFHFNPEFWNKLDNYNRKFVICHEALHVILQHGVRFKGKVPEIANLAADVVINESLVKDFGFRREAIANQQDLCWYDTVFKGKLVEKERSFEYYYNELMKDAKVVEIAAAGGKGQPKTVDQHKGFGSEAQDQVDDKVIEACDGLSDEEVDNLQKKIDTKLDDETKKSLKAGTEAGGMVRVMAKTRVKKKSKWETVIRKWSLKYLKMSDKIREQWARINRRFVTLDSLSGGDVFIPTEMEIDDFEDDKTRIEVMFFLDTSGSCSHLADRFWKAAESLPENRFKIILCCFDTKVYETDFKSRKLYGFGGTSFRIIEEYIQTKIKATRQGKYPDAVFIITDGMGDSVSPARPKNWYWFLSEDYRSCIPKDSNIFMLKDYE